MKSGFCEVSISTGLENLCFSCRCLILFLAWMSSSKCRRCKLVRNEVRLKLRGGLLVLKFQIMMRVFLLMYRDFLEKNACG